MSFYSPCNFGMIASNEFMVIQILQQSWKSIIIVTPVACFDTFIELFAITGSGKEL